MSSRVTGMVVSWPSTTMPSESPTSRTSTPARSESAAMVESYAVIMTIFSPRCFFARRSGTRTGLIGSAILFLDQLQNSLDSFFRCSARAGDREKLARAGAIEFLDFSGLRFQSFQMSGDGLCIAAHDGSGERLDGAIRERVFEAGSRQGS